MNNPITPETASRLAIKAQEMGISVDDLLQRYLASPPPSRAEMHLQGVLDSSLMGIMALSAVRDAHGKIVDFEWTLVNRHAEYLVGYTQAELLGNRMLEMMPGNRQEGLFDAYVQVVETGEPFDAVKHYAHEKANAWFHIMAVKMGDGFVVTFNNLTAYKQAEEALHQSETHYRTLFQEVPVALWKRDISDVNAHLRTLMAEVGAENLEAYLYKHPDVMRACLRRIKTLEINNMVLELYGASSAQELLDNPPSLMSLDRIQAKSLAALARGERSFSGEFVNYRLDGTPFHIFLKWIALPGQHQQYDEMLVVALNITQRKQIEEALRQSEAHYRTLFQEAPIALWKRDFSAVKAHLEALVAADIGDIETYLHNNPQEIATCIRKIRTLEANNIAMAMYGVNSVTQINQKVTDMLSIDPSQAQSLVALLQGKTSFSGEFVNHSIDNKDLHVLLKWIALPGHRETYDEVLVATIDMTEQKQIEKALRQSEAHYRTLFQEMPIAIWRQDYSAIKLYLDMLIQHHGIDDIEAYLHEHPETVHMCVSFVQVIEANAVALQTHQVETLEQLQATFVNSVVENENQPASLAAIARGEYQFVGEFDNKTHNGKTVHLLLKWVAVSGHGADYKQVLVTAIDITEQKRYEHSIREHERLIAQFNKEQEHNALIQRSISALSHDLRTPLSVIATSKDLLLRYFDKLTEEKRKEKLESIGRQLEFALELLDDTVMMIRGKLNERPFRPATINLAQLCRVSVDELGASYNVKHRLNFVNKGNVDMVVVDEVLVSRILLNLLGNALKYSPPNSPVSLELDVHHGDILLRVVDMGIGIAEEELERVFEPFYRGEHVQEIHGTGLGLSIVRECVAQHGGEITVQSDIGKGTTFVVRLPILALA